MDRMAILAETITVTTPEFVPWLLGIMAVLVAAGVVGIWKMSHTVVQLRASMDYWVEQTKANTAIRERVPLIEQDLRHIRTTVDKLCAGMEKGT